MLLYCRQGYEVHTTYLIEKIVSWIQKMKISKKSILILVIIVSAWTFAFFTIRHWYIHSVKIPARVKSLSPIAEFTIGANIGGYYIGDRIDVIAFSPTNPDLIAVAGWEDEIQLWNINNTETPEAKLTGHVGTEIVSNSSVNCLVFLQSGEQLACKTYSTFSLWSIPSGKLLNTNSLDMRSFSSTISPVTPILATGLHDVKLWDLSDPNEIKGTVVLPPKLGQQAISHEDVIWTSGHLSKRATKHHNETINQKYKFIDFSHDGKWLAAGGEMHDYDRKIALDMVKIWDLNTKQLFKIIKSDLPDDFKLGYYYADIYTIKFSPDNRFFAVAHKSGLTIWSLPEWNIYRKVDEPGIFDIAFSPNGNMFATAGRKLKIWLTESKTPIELYENEFAFAHPRIITFSPDGSFLAGGYSDGFVQIWNMRNIAEYK